ncbi:hypothetical protein GCM10009834_26650 [Streptomonospora arabica]
MGAGWGGGRAGHASAPAPAGGAGRGGAGVLGAGAGAAVASRRGAQRGSESPSGFGACGAERTRYSAKALYGARGTLSTAPAPAVGVTAVGWGDIPAGRDRGDESGDSRAPVSRAMPQPVMILGVWRELIVELYPMAEPAAPADAATVALIEKELGLPVPFELASLFAECDGVSNEYGDAVVWPAQRVVEDNLAMRAEPDYVELYAPFHDLVFFGDSDMGPQFAWVHTDYGPGIVVWDHETDRRRLVAVSLRDYLVRCLGEGGGWWR